MPALPNSQLQVKSPKEISALLSRQWQQADKREARLSSDSDAWPLRIPIGKPSAKMVASEIEQVRAHINAWRTVNTGHVEWQSIPYRATDGAIDLPVTWRLDRPSEWINACDNPEVTTEYATLSQLCRHTPSNDHRIWFRQRHLWLGKPAEEIIRASKLADQLDAGCAEGRPLRALPYAGADTKFYERHRALIIRLLDQRHDGAISEQGLEVFLDAAPENTHWILLADLDGNLLHFTQQRVSAVDLARQTQLPGTHLLLVENERALHLLPPSEGTLAILGSGNNLSWLRAPFLKDKQTAYWGDLDTWGLRLLAHARRYLPELPALLMDAATFDNFASQRAVVEPVIAPQPDTGLSDNERSLFHQLSNTQKGRLEQEFLPQEAVYTAINHWCSNY